MGATTGSAASAATLPARLLGAGLTALLALSCSGGGGGSEEKPTLLVLSASEVAPGALLTAQHPQIPASGPVRVTFRTGSGLAIAVAGQPTAAGVLRVPVPPFLDAAAVTATGVFSTGTVQVSVAGIASEQPLRILPIPAYPLGAPGAVLRVVIRLTRESLQALRDKLVASAADTGHDLSRTLATVDRRLASYQAMDAELAAHQQVTLTSGTGSIVLRGAELALAERLCLAQAAGLAAALGVAPAPLAPAAGLAAAAEVGFSLEPVLLAIKEQGLPGVQALSAYVSVLAAVAGAVTAAGTLGASGLAAAAVAMAATGVATLGAAGTAFFLELALDGVRGNDPDATRAWFEAQKVFEAGVTSIALTWAGAAEWIGEWPSVLYDTSEECKGLRDLLCKHLEGGSLRSLAAVAPAPQPFCDGTRNCCSARPPCAAGGLCRFDGAYAGSFSGTCSNDPGSMTLPLNLTIAGGAIVIASYLPGTGTVGVSGTATMTMDDPSAVSGHATFSGTFAVDSARHASGSGTWLEVYPGGTCSGPWSVTRH